MEQYNRVLRDILATGQVKGDRTGTGTIAKFGGMIKCTLQHGIWPVLNSRKVAYKKINEELEWMIKGIVNVKWLQALDNHIWDSWMGADGTIGPMYGEQWRNWNADGQPWTDVDYKELENLLYDAGLEQPSGNLAPYQTIEIVKKFRAERRKPYADGGRGGIDQLQNMIDELKNSPDSRRLCISIWHAGLLPDTAMSPSKNVDEGNMALAPCHSMWQVNTSLITDLEWLRYCEEKVNCVYASMIEMALERHCDLDHEQMEHHIKILGNQYLLREHFIVPKDEYQYSYDLGNDDHFDLLLEGKRKIDILIADNGGKRQRKLSMLCFARSQDVPLGTVFNIGMYSMMAHVLAKLTGMIPWEYTHVMGDYHIYQNQLEGVGELLKRRPKAPPRVEMDIGLKTIDDFSAQHVKVYYDSHPAISFPRAAV